MFYVMIHDQILIIDNSQQHLHQYRFVLFCCKCLRGAATLIVFRLNVNLRRVPRGSILIEKKKKRKMSGMEGLRFFNTHQTFKHMNVFTDVGLCLAIRIT